ncbi:hypothetical protein P8452_64216 [Trifolium repens]|nr:hypothetical protein P8452_64216 [Trifolium repens]
MIILLSLFLVVTNLVVLLPCVKDEDCPPNPLSVVILVWRSVVISRSGLCDVVVSVAEVVGWCLCVWLVVFVML